MKVQLWHITGPPVVAAVLLASLAAPAGTSTTEQAIFAILFGLAVSLAMKRVRPEWDAPERAKRTVLKIMSAEAVLGIIIWSLVRLT
jgi:hypothetical protein